MLKGKAVGSYLVKKGTNGNTLTGFPHLKFLIESVLCSG